jgi:O-antigen/teichoic acid export membrane protein
MSSDRGSSKRGHGLRRIAEEFARNARLFGFGLLAQTFSAATNFGLVVIAGHVLGASGLGTLLIGFAAYMLLLGFLRALVTEPLVASSSGREPAEKASSARAALTLALVTSVAAAGLLTAIGIALPTRIGRSMLLFAPWLAPALIQDLGRSIVFRDRAGRSAVFSDATWLLTMAAAAPFAFTSESDWVVVASWGVGAVPGAGVALGQLRWRPVPLGRAVEWWKLEARPLARWLGVQALLFNVVAYATVLLLAGILGSRDYGGLRAVQSVFAPLSLLGPALALPGLPLVSRLVVDARRRALRVAAEIAGLITAVTGAYVVALYAVPDVLVFLFGQEFAAFRSIMIPIGVGQLLAAPAFGLTLFLKATQRGRTLLWLGTLNVVVYLVLTVVLGLAFGLSGAAWGAVGTGAVSAAALLFVFRRSTWNS